MQPAPLVSVVLATYNWPSVLSYAIQTVLWQTFTDFELLIIGDCCTDNTEEVVRSFNDPRISWHNLPSNTGNQAGPNNAGLERARGKYIAYMHQDDLWLPTHLEVLVKAFGAKNHFAAHTLCLLISPVSFDADERVRFVMGLPNTGYHLGPEKRGIYTPTLMHRTDAGRAIGGWRDWKSIRETPFVDFIERLSSPVWTIMTVPEITVVKFNSAERRNSYLEQRCEEQAAYFHRIRSEPDFLSREMLLALEAIASGKRPMRVLTDCKGAPRGWKIAQYRWLRGLEKEPAHMQRPTKSFVRIAVRKVARAVRWFIPSAFRKKLADEIIRLGRFLKTQSDVDFGNSNFERDTPKPERDP